MRKFIFIIPLSLIFVFCFPLVFSKAASYDLDQVKTILIVPYDYGSDGFDVIGFLEDSVDIVNMPNMSSRWTTTGTYAGVPRPLTSFDSSWSIDTIVEFLDTQCTGFGFGGNPDNPDYSKSYSSIVYVYRGSIGSTVDGVTPLTPRPPDPPDPDPGSTWLEDMWEWFLWQLGINDDYSGDIDEFITGGDRERMELVTPTPTPLPPSPTPIVMPITDTNGNTIWNVTYPQGDGGGGNTTNNYYGDEFDVFEVDLKVGDGGTSNPRDGINSVMDSNYDYLEDVDITPVSGSFSVLPSDWYLLIGVLISFPVIAGFISKLLK